MDASESAADRRLERAGAATALLAVVGLLAILYRPPFATWLGVGPVEVTASASALTRTG